MSDHLIVGGVDTLRRWRDRATGTVALVPTMGALHDGHRRLIDRARTVADTVVVSDFVNPLQFGPDEDFDRYPRDLEADAQICRDAGVDMLFAPEQREMYPHPVQVSVSAGKMGTLFEGAARPGHFDGVLTVVAKLFQLVRPHRAVFGQKDAQQLALVERLCIDLNLGVQIDAAPIVRDTDSLALSSRNRYLSPSERTAALALPRAVAAATGLAGADDPADSAAVPQVQRAVSDVLRTAEQRHPHFSVDYASIVDRATFAECPPDFRGEALLLLAAHSGPTRLIDNAPLHF